MVSWSNEIAIVGVGTTQFGSFPETDALGLGLEAFVNAMEDCGMSASDIDGLVTNRASNYQKIGECLGINPSWSLQLETSGRMSAASIIEAALAISRGLASSVALIYGNNGKSQRVNYGGTERASTDPFAPWGFTSPGAIHAMMFRMHMEKYGTTTDQLGEIAVAFRNHAQLNPLAVRREPMTVEDHRKSRYVCDPLRLFDYCQINDGGVALIMTSMDRAKDLLNIPVRIAGIGLADSFVNSTLPPTDFWYPALQKCAEQVYGSAGVSTHDIDVLMAYDNFTPTVLFTLEGLGFCKQGESGSLVENGGLSLGGSLPTNTSGGHLSESYMQGWALNVEAVRQLRGECGKRQVPNCELVQYASATPRSLSLIYSR